MLSFCAECFVFQFASKNIKIKTYRNIILPVVLYACETWSLTLREERRPRVFENSVLKKIFGPKREEVRGEWRKLHNEELNPLKTNDRLLYLKTQFILRSKHFISIIKNNQFML